ncbi:MAG: FAD-binding domain-containing protein, partial [Gemmataceae bacterium]
QGIKFDPSGSYVRKWVPEIDKLPDSFIHQPWDAPEKILRECGITLGETYPSPIVDHSAARETALEAFQNLK